MFARHLLTATVLGFATAWAAPAPAQETDLAPPAAESPAEDIAELIRQLDADRFSDRQAASNKLEAAGELAISHLIETAENGSVEASARAVNILAAHLSARDAATKAAAREALEKLAESKNASTARRAKAAIEESQKPQPAPAPGEVRILRNARILFGGAMPGGQIQVRVQQRAVGGGRQVTVTTVNGVKTINAIEGNRKVQIKDDPQNGIEMEVTETKDGKAAIQKYQAKDADDLKKKHPDAYKLYNEYARPGAVQVQQLGDARRRAVDAQMNLLERATDSLQRSLDRLEIAGGKEREKEIKQHLENVKKELEQVRRKLDDEEEKPAEK